ncbi:hypothetical protein [Caballeronia novacaledonica]|nr:hypothetical protein [Caballeronia novacaledonica]
MAATHRIAESLALVEIEVRIGSRDIRESRRDVGDEDVESGKFASRQDQ